MLLLALASLLTAQNLPDSVTTNTFANPLYEKSETESRKLANIKANTTVSVHHILKSGNILWVRVATGRETGWFTIDELDARSRIDVRNYAIAVLGGDVEAGAEPTGAADGQVQGIRVGSGGGFVEDFMTIGLIPAIVVLFGLIGWVMLRRK